MGEQVIDLLARFQDLPDVLCLKTLAELNPKDLGRMSCATKASKILADDDVVWEQLYKRSFQGHHPGAAQQVVPWKRTYLFKAPTSTMAIGGIGGAPFDDGSVAYSRAVLGEALQVAGYYRFPHPFLNSVTAADFNHCKVITGFRVWEDSSFQHIRAIQLQFDNDWADWHGATDEYRQFPSSPYHTVALGANEHIIAVRCSEGPCRWAKRVVLGVEFSTSMGRQFRYGEWASEGSGGIHETEFTFPLRLTNIWGRNGYVVDQLGFDYL